MIAALIVALVVSQPVPPAERVERARVCSEALDFECAARELDAAAPRLSELSPAVRLLALRLRAETAFALGENPTAHLRALLADSPDFEPDAKAWPERWRRALDEVRATMPDREPPVLTVRVPVSVTPGRSFEVMVEASDRSGVGGVTLWVAGAPDARVTLVTADGRTWRGEVPAERVVEPAVGLWVEASDLKGNGPARWGSPGAPRRVQVMPPAGSGEPQTDEGLVDQWWFWTAIGGAAAVAVATGVTVWMLTRDDGNGAGPAAVGGEAGSVEVRLPTWFVP